MSTHQHAKPRRANQSITDESARPGTERSNVGCDAIDEPCTNRTAGLPSGESRYFSQRKRRTSPLFVQCSRPGTGVYKESAGVVMEEPFSRALQYGCSRAAATQPLQSFDS